jgi:8-oxo-dGTP pyrophosphatase MutT (NUDIX family)
MVRPARFRLALGLLVWLTGFPGVTSGSGNPDNIEAAGCLIATQDGFVMGINRLINRLQLPVGRHVVGESARHTAARETLEETGIEVEVGEVALELDNQRVVFFFCRPVDTGIDFNNLKPRDRIEVSRAMVVNPITLETPDGDLVTTPWRFPEMRWLLRSVFQSAAETGSPTNLSGTESRAD